MQLSESLDMTKFKDSLKKSHVHQQKYLDAVLTIKEQQLVYNIDTHVDQMRVIRFGTNCQGWSHQFKHRPPEDFRPRRLVQRCVQN